MANIDLKTAKKAKNDEFYTQWIDIEKEILAYLDYNPNVFRGKIILLPCDDPNLSNFTKFFAQNFVKFGLKKLISTSYAHKNKNANVCSQTAFVKEQTTISTQDLNIIKGKIFTLDYNTCKNINIEDLKFKYLNGDGDFRSNEIKKLQTEADIIITNPPFSLFREFLSWITQSNKQFLIIGNINCITYKEVFSLIKKNKIWLGTGMGRAISGFIVPENYELYGSETRIDDNGNRIVATNNCLWLTNIDHGRRHKPLQLMTMKDNIKYSKHKNVKKLKYPKYDNFNAIEVPYTDAIPSDYDGIMGVPITFLNKYNPKQFEIIGLGNGIDLFTPSKKYVNTIMYKNGKLSNGNAINKVLVYPTDKNNTKIYYKAENSNKYLFAPYARVLIKRKSQ